MRFHTSLYYTHIFQKVNSFSVFFLKNQRFSIRPQPFYYITKSPTRQQKYRRKTGDKIAAKNKKNRLKRLNTCKKHTAKHHPKTHSQAPPASS
jgi:hypothetical protein